MSRVIGRDRVVTRIREGAQLVEVLPASSYERKHIAGAMNLPLKELDPEAAARMLDPDRPVIVYCNDAA